MSEIPQPKVPRGLVFAVFALLWIFPSLGAVLILANGSNAWREAGDLPDAVRAITIEQWLAIALIVVHGVLVWLACAGRGFTMLRRGIADHS